MNLVHALTNGSAWRAARLCQETFLHGRHLNHTTFAAIERRLKYLKPFVVNGGRGEDRQPSEHLFFHRKFSPFSGCVKTVCSSEGLPSKLRQRYPCTRMSARSPDILIEIFHEFTHYAPIRPQALPSRNFPIILLHLKFSEINTNSTVFWVVTLCSSEWFPCFGGGYHPHLCRLLCLLFDSKDGVDVFIRNVTLS